MRSSIAQLPSIYLDRLTSEQPSLRNCDEDLMGQLPRLWNCLEAAAREYQPRYTDKLETLLATSPQGSRGVVLRAQGMEGMSSGERFSDWYRVIKTLPLETGGQDTHTGGGKRNYMVMMI